MITCPNCGTQNRNSAKFCMQCGTALPQCGTALPQFGTVLSPNSAASDRERSLPTKSGSIEGLVSIVKRWVEGVEPLSSSHSAPSPTSANPLPIKAQTSGAAPEASTVTRPIALAQTAPQNTSQAISLLQPLEPDSVLSHPRDPRQRYGIVTSRQLPRSIYYCAVDLNCPVCGALQSRVPPDGLCRQCQAPLRPVLIHERRPRPNGRLSGVDIEQLIRLSTEHPSIVSHQAVMQYQESVYTVVNYPGRWDTLGGGQPPRSAQAALTGAMQAGECLAYLHDHGFAHMEVGGASIESLIVVGNEHHIKLADLSACARLHSDDAQTLQTQVNSDTAFLAWLLFYLTTGKELSRTSIELAPPELRSLVEQALQGQYNSVQDMLDDFSLLPPTPTPARSLKPSHGQATHPGRQHTRNEDAVVTFTYDKEQDGHSVPIGFYLVADGMGGHEAGDLASRAVNQIVTDWIIKTKVLPDLLKVTRRLDADDAEMSMPSELLTQAICQANEALLRHGQATGSDLGSTVTAALIIGDVATIANVGDSRTYLLRGGRLQQITKDHSLVARLVEAGVIGAEEIRTHPQRNQIYRCLGHRPAVKVDTFTRQMQAGDLLVLCSDGLWEMVLDAQIKRIIGSSLSPQTACDALVEAANHAGGEDNIAAIVVKME
jgi:serine/threonine protein phosphatase PrpC